MKHIRAVLPFLILSLCIAGCGGGQTPADLNHIAGQRGLAPNSADTFRFVVMTDRNGGQEVGKWAIAVDEVNRLRPDFVMCIGDLTRGYKENPPLTEQEWNEFREENKALRAPFFFTPGNHDVLGVETRKAYGLRHNVNGAPYYSFDYRGCHFAVIDTTCMIEPKARTPEAPLAGAQWAWLAKDLAAAKGARHTFLLMHHPLWRYSSVWEKLRPMLDPARVTLFAGHTHNLDYSEIDGVPCHTLSVTAAKTSGERARGSFQMYAFVTVDAGRPAVTYMPVGSALPLNAVDLAAEAIAQSAMEDAAMSTLGVSGGRTTLRLSNTSKYPMSCDLRWSGSAADPVAGRREGPGADPGEDRETGVPSTSDAFGGVEIAGHAQHPGEDVGPRALLGGCGRGRGRGDRAVPGCLDPARGLGSVPLEERRKDLVRLLHLRRVDERVVAGRRDRLDVVSCAPRRRPGVPCPRVGRVVRVETEGCDPGNAREGRQGVERGGLAVARAPPAGTRDDQEPLAQRPLERRQRLGHEAGRAGAVEGVQLRVGLRRVDDERGHDPEALATGREPQHVVGRVVDRAEVAAEEKDRAGGRRESHLSLSLSLLCSAFFGTEVTSGTDDRTSAHPALTEWRKNQSSVVDAATILGISTRKNNAVHDIRPHP